MWNLNKDGKGRFEKVHLLPIPESDEEWEITLREAEEEGEDLFGRLRQDLEEVKAELLQILPERFLPYVEDGTLNKPSLPKDVRVDYLQWMESETRKFERILDAAYENKQEAATHLSDTAQEVFADSFHDSTIERLEREGDDLHLYINTDGGFTSKSMIHLIFKGIRSEASDEPLQVGQFFIYDELIKIENGFAFRVLFDCPTSQWTIEVNDIDAEYFYRPKAYTHIMDEGKLEETSLSEYTAMINPDYNYWLFTPDVECAITNLSEEITIEGGNIEFSEDEMVVTAGDRRFYYDLSEHHPIRFIYTDVYEDAYAHFQEPVPTEELEEAALGEDLELQVRAWNTMYGNPHELATIINTILGKVEINEENEMMLYVYTNHFFKEGILTKANVEKFRDVIEN